MHAALIFEETSQRTLVPKQVVGLAAVLLAGTAITPINIQGIQDIGSETKSGAKMVVKGTELLTPSMGNLKIMEEKDGTQLFSFVNVKTIALIETKKNIVELRDKIKSSVLSWQGIRYQWGGCTKTGVDCSGLVQRVFNEHGIRLPRTSYEQFKKGVGIPKAKLETGDLVFFNTNGTGASHVGIYLGENQFISATKNSVEVQSLEESYWSKTYRGARRVIEL